MILTHTLMVENKLEEGPHRREDVVLAVNDAVHRFDDSSLSGQVCTANLDKITVLMFMCTVILICMKDRVFSSLPSL